MELGMSVCHNLIEIGGRLKGDEIDLAIFKQIDAKIVDNKIKFKN